MRSSRGDATRHRGREAALQLLYQWEVGRLEAPLLAEAGELYWASHPGSPTTRAFADWLAVGTRTHLDTIDPVIAAHAANWRLSRMAVVDRLIIRMAVYELLHSDTPPAVVINEALELSKTYGGEQTSRFVNGVLDGITRAVEQGRVPVGGETSG